jgi:glycyl-tRNA synthetase beta chain
LAARKERIVLIVRLICEGLRAEGHLNEGTAIEIARLCLADLMSDVVKEFPELQGTMGGVLARHEELDERVALGLEEFYFPVGPQGPLPTTDEGAIVSLAGKLDALCGAFSVGEEPTGSADPFALRRQALGIVRILIEKQLPLNVDDLLMHAIVSQPESGKAGTDAQSILKIRDFIWARAQSFFEERGYRVDEVRAIREGAFDDFPRAFRRLAALHAVRSTPGFESLAAAFKRASNIIKQAHFAADGAAALERDAFKEEAEIALYDRLAELEGKVSALFKVGDYEDGLKTLAAVKEPLDHFFDKVLVMAEDESVRTRRLALLSRLLSVFRQAADISELQVG